ncbi:TRAP transporter substrate-binding protein [Fodinicurvata sp. EGI_FJ10296]|uniref:TRAP transporter substrate-binding protein n=1 Tax=Fodinicurvata sp. EGI_FJ10296 TaxID=3231908 RepID=UPI0034546FD9
MSVLFRNCLIAGVSAVICAGAATTASAQSLSLRLSSENPPGGNTVHILNRFAEHLEESLGDDVEIEIFDSGVLGNEEVHLQQIRTGQIDVHSTGSDAIQLDPKWAIFDMPFLFANRDVVAEILDGEIGEEMAASMREAAGIEVLGYGEIGFRQMTNNIRPINVPEDMDGMRIRIPGSETRALMLETFGAVPVDINFGELYLALQQNTVDGQENPLISIDAGSFQEVQEYLSITNHVYTPITLTMNGETYDNLTDEQRTAVEEAARAAVEWTRQNGADADDRLITAFEEEMEINQADIPAFREASQPVYDSVAELAGADFVERLLAAVEAAGE